MLKQLVKTGNIQHRALKLRIYPSKEQTELINKTFGCCRQIYNNRLFERNQFYNTVIKREQDKKKQKELWKSAKFSTEKEMGERFPYLKEVSSQALQQARRDSETAYKNFFESLKGKRAGSKRLAKGKRNCYCYNARTRRNRNEAKTCEL